jgi:hypothetical protein
MLYIMAVQAEEAAGRKLSGEAQLLVLLLQVL